MIKSGSYKLQGFWNTKKDIIHQWTNKKRSCYQGVWWKYCSDGVVFLNFDKFKYMYNLTKLKILVIGPEASGKTAVVNYLSQKSNVLEAPYRPTNSVRIV